MADVRPFLGLRYDLKRVGSLSLVIAPPYDVIPPEEESSYLQRSPYNIVRLEGVAGPLHLKKHNEHVQAASLLSAWIREGILRQDSRPSCYLVKYCFTHRGKSQSCWSLLCRVKLEDPGQGQIYLHEATSSEPIRDRLLLLRACRANLSPVIALFQGELLPVLLPEVLSRPPTATAEEKGVTYSLWVVDQESLLLRISEFFAPKPLCLADGHHRYEAARLYRGETLSHSDHRDFVLMSLFNAEDPGLLVLPLHRLIGGISAQDVAAFEEKLKFYFQVRKLPSSRPATWLTRLEEESRRTKAIGLYQPFERRFALLTPRRERIEALLPTHIPPLWKEIELNLLHRVILQELLGIKPEQEGCLSYCTDGLEAINQADEKGKLAFLLNPLSPSQIMALAQANLRLPRKSSYFYPKTPAGLVINPLWG